jgi:hypothetical protein
VAEHAVGLTLALAALALVLLTVWAWPRWQLRRALARPFPAAWESILQQHVPIVSRLPADLAGQLRRLIQHFVHAKQFVGCAGQDIDDTVRVTIAAQACLLLLNRPSRVYPRLHTILVYPGAFAVPRREVDAAGVVSEARQPLLGESWEDGRVVLSWDHVLDGARDGEEGQNVVLHEFAHQLDSESGSNNGAPFLGDPARYQRWAEVLSRDFEQLRSAAMVRQPGVIDHYGAHSPAEFFAVATETFFLRPWQMAERHAELYGELQGYFRVDPRAWVPAPQPDPHEAMAPAWGQAAWPGYGMPYGQWH